MGTLKTVAYCRNSTDRQEERQTIQTQKAEIERYCTREGLVIDEWYEDPGVSGAVPVAARPSGKRLLDAVRRGEVGVILVYKLQRLGREPYDVLATVALLRTRRVDLISTTEQLGEGSHATLSTGMLAVFSGFERELIVERAVAGLARTVREGRWPGGTPPYGYDLQREKVGSTLVVSERVDRATGLLEREIVRMIYAWYTRERHSLVQITRRLNELGIVPPFARDGILERKGKPVRAIWHPGRVRALLISPVYRGTFNYTFQATGERLTHEVPALVDLGTWELAQETLSANRHLLSGHAQHPYLLVGLIRCGHCPYTYTASASGVRKDGRRSFIYRCGGRLLQNQVAGAGACCPGSAVAAADVEAVTWANVVHVLSLPTEELIARLVQEEPEADEVEQRLVALRESLAAKDIARQELIALRADGVITRGELANHLERIENQKAALEQEIVAASARASRVAALRAGQEDLAARLQRYQKEIHGAIPFERRRAIVQDLVERVEVRTRKEGRRVKAEYRVVIRFDLAGVVHETEKKGDSSVTARVTRFHLVIAVPGRMAA